MTTPQILAFAILAAMMALFVWGRLRYDMVAVLALLAGVAAGIVPTDKAFSGYADDIVIIVASALVVSAAVARSGVIETVLRPLAPYLTTPTIQIFMLTAVVAALSGFVKNIGALAMMMPVAFQLARKTGTPASAMLMPMAFGSLLGGIVTLVGTSPNIIVSRVREEVLGAPFSMFDFAPVGILLAIGGVAFLAFGWRLLPERKGAASMDAAFNLEGYTTEVSVPEDSEFAGKTVKDLEALVEDEVEVLAILRRRQRNSSPSGAMKLRAGDVIILQGEPAALERAVGAAKLTLVRDEVTKETDTPSDDIGVMEAIVTPESLLVGNTPARMRLYDTYQVNLLAVSRAGEAHRPSVAFGPTEGRRRDRSAGRSEGDARGARRIARASAGRTRTGAGPRPPRFHSGDRAGDRDAAGRASSGAGRHRIFRNRCHHHLAQGDFAA